MLLSLPLSLLVLVLVLVRLWYAPARGTIIAPVARLGKRASKGI